MASLLTKPVMIRCSSRLDDQVYVGAVPLRAAKGLPQSIMSAAYSFRLWDFQHFLVIIHRSSPRPNSQSQVIVFDFQPKDPDNVYTALAVLSGAAVPGAVRVRKLPKLPRCKTWFIGSSNVDGIDAAAKFNDNWATDLRVGHHDCRDYTNGLVELLVGEKDVLERLRRSSDSQG